MATKFAKIRDWYQGNKRLLIFDVIDKDHGDMPLDLSNRTVKWTLARAKDGSYQKENVLEKKTGGSGIVATPLSRVLTALVNAGGTGYVVGDELLVSGGVGNPAFVTVATVSGTTVLTVTVTEAGTYITTPGATGVATTVPGNVAASGCTLNLTYITYAGRALVTVPSADTVELLGDYHQELEVFDALSEAAVVGVGDVTFLRNVENT